MATSSNNFEFSGSGVV